MISSGGATACAAHERTAQRNAAAAIYPKSYRSRRGPRYSCGAGGTPVATQARMHQPISCAHRRADALQAQRSIKSPGCFPKWNFSGGYLSKVR